MKNQFKIGIFAPADYIDKSKFAVAVSNLKKQIPDTEFIIPPNLFKKHGLFAGTETEKISDLNFLLQRKPDMIMSGRGGYGSARLLNLIDYRAIKNSGAKFTGYSDCTSLLITINQMTGAITYYGYMLNSDFSGRIYSRKIRLLTDILNCSEIKYSLPCKIIKLPEKCLTRSQTQTQTRGYKFCGKSIAGCLSILTTLTGTRFFKQYLEKNVMFIEDVNEEPYKIDRMLTHLKNAGIFENTAALFVDFNNCKPSPKNKGTISIKQTMLELFKDYDFPIINFPHFGHRKNKIVIPVGCVTEIVFPANSVSGRATLKFHI